jgi:hypothetical protein
MWKQKFSSDRGGGGGIGIIVGIFQDTMTMDGRIIGGIRPGIDGYPMTGETTIETMYGGDGLGIIIPYITVILTDTGGAIIGEIIMDGNILADTVAASIMTVAGTEDMADTAVMKAETKDNKDNTEY